MSPQNILFEPMNLGDTAIQHRIVMAPLTRVRSKDNHTPSEMAIEYYGQRSSTPGTLIITEATFIDAAAGGRDNIPGIYTDEHIDAWKRIVDKVHEQNSKIYLQLWALGRAGSSALLKKELGEDAKVVSASDIPITGRDTPTPMTKEEIKQYVQWYARAASYFVHRAGGDGVEIHGANGYLIDQFLQTVSNKRTDEYGGSVENRTRFAFEVLEAVTNAIGESKTAIRMSPFSLFQDMRMSDQETQETFTYYTKEIRKRYPKLSYLHVILPRVSGNADTNAISDSESIDFIYDIWKPLPFMIAGGLKADTIEREVNKYENCAVAMGRYFISNPDLPLRIKENAALTPYNRDTFYTFSHVGYTDYPFMTKTQA